ncbi:four-carbon acid sugar kinase family protein [Rhizobiales bacterium RZME27]|uniref:Four-carbon acid sugar kinase family protein n=1 Tax=Endobacterium cereale TaxID=2663029 RepID=A0A6A8ACW6_9HYPH|nr:four-carbon acid sugar kinase family protein [Endobacterium cereale]MEB2845387.1 four-carbon acid sugar kinase family protein [Endobacterium cereale]MQY48982.1 four-carbon acid sugar kinase family protein [Endobacterium cereale]
MLAILADDLTGALDSAAPFAGRGLRTEVALAREAIAGIVEDRPDVISINLNTREIGADEARETTAAVMALLPSGTLLFKKVDSRLKGNIVAELDAIPFSRALVAPAIPEFDRIVENGAVCGFGIDTPIVIAAKLGSHAARAHTPDTRSPADMDAVLDAAQTDGTDLLIGARGLAEALARRMTAGRNAQPAKISTGRTTFVIGSRDPITLAQIDALRAGHDLDYLAAPNGELTETPDTDATLTLVQVTPGTSEINPVLASEALAEGLKDSLSGYNGTLLLSGGATAEAVMRVLGVSRFTLHGECLPGLGLASSEGRCIIAKSGGFGKPDTLKTIADMVLGRAI